MLAVSRIKHKALKSLVGDGDESKIKPDWLPRVKRILAALNVAAAASELDTPGWHWHELRGDRRGTFSVRVSGNWRVTFRWDDDGPYDVNLEDYHGR